MPRKKEAAPSKLSITAPQLESPSPSLTHVNFRSLSPSHLEEQKNQAVAHVELADDRATPAEEEPIDEQTPLVSSVSPPLVPRSHRAGSSEIPASIDRQSIELSVSPPQALAGELVARRLSSSLRSNLSPRALSNLPANLSPMAESVERKHSDSAQVELPDEQKEEEHQLLKKRLPPSEKGQEARVFNSRAAFFKAAGTMVNLGATASYPHINPRNDIRLGLLMAGTGLVLTGFAYKIKNVIQEENIQQEKKQQLKDNTLELLNKSSLTRKRQNAIIAEQRLNINSTKHSPAALYDGVSAGLDLLFACAIAWLGYGKEVDGDSNSVLMAVLCISFIYQFLLYSVKYLSDNQKAQAEDRMRALQYLADTVRDQPMQPASSPPRPD